MSAAGSTGDAAVQSSRATGGGGRADQAGPLAIPRLNGPVRARVRLPGSKSITNRALVCAGLASGASSLRGPLVADDTEAMVDAMVALGATVDRSDPQRWTVIGTGGALTPGPLTIDARQSGTTSRFVAPVLALGSGRYTLDGHAQLRGRPFADLIGALSALGVSVEAAEGKHLPLTVTGGTASGRIARLGAEVSSQFASGLLLAAPCLPEGLEIELVGPIVSRPYLALTVAVMRSFGASVEVSDAVDRFVVAPGGYRPTDFVVEPDASTASYFWALGALSGGSVTVEGLGAASVQGDAGFADVLARMGAVVERDATSTTVAGTGPLTAIRVELSDLSDTAPTLAAVAATATGTTEVSGIGFIRHKESDRIAAMVTELSRLGFDAREDPDGFTVVGAPAVAPAASGGGDEAAVTVVDTYDDHRIAMALTVLGLVRGGVAVADPGCVAKTFPGFFDEIFRLASSPGMGTSNSSASTPSSIAAAAVIAIDGPSGSGKSTVARSVAERLGVDYLDTGAMYRAVAFAALRHDLDPGDDTAVAALAREIDLSVGPEGVIVDGIDGTVEIRGPEVTRAVSAVAANPAVRTELQRRQRDWATKHGGGVIEGRDIGSVVFPDARLKVFLTARSDVRAGRRAQEVTDLDYETVAADLVRRDTADSQREHNPLTRAADAVEIETTDLSVDAVVDRVIALLASGEGG